MAIDDFLTSELGMIALGPLGGGIAAGLDEFGFFDEGGIFGDPSKAASRAADAQVAGKEAGIDTINQELSPFRDAGLQGLQGQVEGSTAQGLDARLQQIFGGGAFQNLLGERTSAVQGQLAASGQSRSGAGLKAAAAVPGDLALQLDQLLNQRQTNLSGQGFNAATGIAGGVSALQSGIGQDIGSGILGDAQAKAGQQEQLVGLATTAASFFSDPRLKTNIKPVGHFHDLEVFIWDWIPEVVGTIIEGAPTFGFMADKVKEKYPQFIQEFGGFMTIDMPGLLNKMETA